ncbi:MAG: YXWGXW repeat-containing protein [Acidisphaera sp.]|nr:YXWGXW repeat-containing protein [Acidisphaera sp.]
MRKPHLLLVAAMLGLAGCVAVAPAPVYPQVPPPISETIPNPPVSERPLTWQPGHWDWSGSGYAWRPGEYVSREGRGSLWQDGYWAFNGGVWQWVPGHWL